MTTIPSEIVSKFYETDPQTDDLLPDGEHLKDGMVVLIESRMLREYVSNSDEVVRPYRQDRIKENNRWAAVSHLVYHGDIVSFIATYADGTKRKRTYACGYAWVVKLDSVPNDEQLPTCDHAIDTPYLHCTTVGCSNYAGLFA